MNSDHPRNKLSIPKLAQQILHHKELYYKGEAVLSDEDYDQLEENLRQLEPSHPVLATVGFLSTKSTKKIAHKPAMLSLAKTYKESELLAWALQEKVLATAKIDGVSLSLVYDENAQFLLAKTRGNGKEGEDVSDKVRWVSDCVFSLGQEAKALAKKTGGFEVRGELFCRQASFPKLALEMQALGLERPKSQRNIVAGLLSRKKHLFLTKYFNFFAFDLLLQAATKEDFLAYKSEHEKLLWLKKAGFHLPEFALLAEKKEVLAYLQAWPKKSAQLTYNCDGLVFTFNDLKQHAKLGATAHHPRFKLSFKWQGELACSLIEEILWNTSRLGIVTPVAKIKAVHLSAAVITHVSLHNLAFLQAQQLAPGDEVQIIRSGEVIPKYLATVKKGKNKTSHPTHCPSCQTKLVSDSVRLLCPNKLSCQAQKVGRLQTWVKAVDIQDLSEKRLSLLFEHGLVSSISSLYQLKKEELLSLPLIQEKLATKLMRALEKSKQADLVSFLSGLGIQGLGRQSWLELTKSYDSLEKIRSLELEELLALRGFQEKTAKQVLLGLENLKNEIKQLLELGFSPKLENKALSSTSSSPWSDKVFVISGSFSVPRQELKRKLESFGIKVSSAVSQKTSVLLLEDKKSSSQKAVVAKKLGVEIWDEKMLNEKVF